MWHTLPLISYSGMVFVINKRRKKKTHSQQNSQNPQSNSNYN